MRKWRIEDSEELYNITGWGTSYFGINDKGHVVVTCLLYTSYPIRRSNVSLI